MPERPPRRFRRSLIITVYGPLVGGLIAYGLFLVLNVGDPPDGDDMVYVVVSTLTITIAIGWVTGLPAAALSALIWYVLEPSLGGMLRFAAALLIGFVTSAATAVPIIYAVTGNHLINLNGYAAIGAIGAVAMAITALPSGKKA